MSDIFCLLRACLTLGSLLDSFQKVQESKGKLQDRTQFNKMINEFDYIKVLKTLTCQRVARNRNFSQPSQLAKLIMDLRECLMWGSTQEIFLLSFCYCQVLGFFLLPPCKKYIQIQIAYCRVYQLHTILVLVPLFQNNNLVNSKKRSKTLCIAKPTDYE